MATYTTEITSDSIESDNPIHQRLIKAYYIAAPYFSGEMLEIGCGEGRGIDLIEGKCQRYMAVDKNGPIIERLRARYPWGEFKQMDIPPLRGIADNSFDRVISFQVIEHIKDDKAYLQEIKRILRPGGIALITTPNRKFTLTRNPWHQREYLAEELSKLCNLVFEQVEIKGVGGNEKVMEYYNQNKASVQKITRFDVFDLQHKLPASWLQWPYEILNRMNRKKLQQGNNQLVSGISHQDYILTENPEQGLDLFCILTKD